MGENVIELNGKRYDAITGAYLGKSHVVPKRLADNFVHGKVIDGFVRPAHPAVKRPHPATAPVQRAEVKPEPVREEHHDKHAHSPAAHVKAHRPEHSKTLMRRATRKPEFARKPRIKAQPAAEIMAKPASAIAHKRSAYSVDPSRQERAGVINRHQAVRHFHPAGKPPALHTVSAEVPVIAVRQAPARPAPRPQPDIFEKAIARANSHKEPLHKVRRHNSHRRLRNSLAVIAAFLVIGGFMTYLNLPQLQLRVASVQTGFGASMPSYVPTGYALENGVERSGGTVSLSFRSGEQSFRITQQSSEWNSQTLLDNTLALNGQHKTIEQNGQTIFVYENAKSAAWVNGGVRYDITGNAQLSEDEIVSIASSL